jgi:hypothetical protein
LKRTKVRGDRRPDAKTANKPRPVPVQTWTFLDAGDVQTLTEVDATARVDVAEMSQNVTFLAPVPVQSGDPVTALQEALQAPQDGSGAAPFLEPPCSQGTPMHAPGEADSEATSWMPNDLMDVSAGAALGNIPCNQGTPMQSAVGSAVSAPPDGSPAAVCSPLPAGPTAPTIEPVEPRPAVAATRSPVIVRPDLYARLAAQRRAAAVPA